MLVDTLIVAVIVGLLMRGSLRNVASLEIKALPLMFGAMLLQFVFLTLAGKGWGFAIQYGPFFYVLSFFLLLVALWQNRKDPAFCVIGLGVALNFAVIVANGGHMPVSEQGIQAVGLTDMIPQLTDGSYITHGIMTDSTVLKFLGDIFATPSFYPRSKVFSIGDVIMGLGVLWLIPREMLGKNKKSKFGLKG